MKKSNILFCVIAVSVFLGIIYVAVNCNLGSQDADSAIARTVPGTDLLAEEGATVLKPVSTDESIVRPDGEEMPQEIVRSIYDYDLDYREAAQQAADSHIALFSSDSVTRYRPVRLEPSNFLTGSYLDEGSVATSFSISPFPDTTFTVVATKYTIREYTESASWEGAIVGSDDGRVLIKIIGGVDDPGFIIKITNGPQVISIVPTLTTDAYIALEGNPHRPPPTL